MRLAVVDGDTRSAQQLVAALNAKGCAAQYRRRGVELLSAHRHYDAVILDLGRTDMDGLRVLRLLRKVSSVPVVIVTDRDDERAIVRALRAGADDCLVKPTNVTELLARLEAVTRRAGGCPTGSSDIVTTGDIRIDMGKREVHVAGNRIALTRVEFELARVLVERPGLAVSRTTLMQRVWGDTGPATSRTLNVHMVSLRAKLGRPGLITTIRGHGYRWAG